MIVGIRLPSYRARHSGTVDDCELVNGVVFDKRISHIASGLDRMENAKIGLIQFCLSPPKTDVSG